MDTKKIQFLLHNTGNIAITVLGDYCLDKYLYIDSSRDEPSIETGLTAYQVVRKEIYPGASGTITNNLRALGVKVNCIGLVGDDGEGYELLKSLKKINADTSLMVRTDVLCTNTYTKPMRMEKDIYRELNRLDFRNFEPTPDALQNQIIENIEKAVKVSNAVILSDQFYERNCSVITERVRTFIAQLALEYPDVVFYADSRRFIDEYRNVIVKCNHFEAVKCILPDHIGPVTEEILLDCGLRLYKRNKRTVYITQGEKGSIVFDKEITSVPGFRVEEPLDVCGAGDATNAGIVLGLALGLDQVEAALLGNSISSITIQQIGVTGTATVEQVIERLSTITS